MRMAEIRVGAKAIPEARDQMQSLGLSLGVGGLLVVCCVATLMICWELGSVQALLQTLLVSTLFALAAWCLGAATPAAAMTGGAVCLQLTFWTARELSQPFASALSSLIVLFLLTFLATRAGRGRKIAAGLAENRRGRRASQVIANLGVAALCAYCFRASPDVGRIVVLAALAEATADTVSSEVGQGFGGQPWLLTTWRRVPAGTDGAISVRGTAAGVVAAGAVTACGGPAIHGGTGQLTIALGAGCAGLIFDSLLGATVERRGWLGNDLVNFTSTLFSVGFAWCLLKLFYPA